MRLVALDGVEGRHVAGRRVGVADAVADDEVLRGDRAGRRRVGLVLVATRAVHRVRPGFVSSVAGRLRWRWLLHCLLAVLPLWVVYLGLGFVLDPPSSGRPEQ